MSAQYERPLRVLDGGPRVRRVHGALPGGAHHAHVPHAVALARVADAEEAVVIGGATLFADALPAAGRFHLTQVHAEIDGDTFFPKFDRDHWREISRDHHPADGDNPAYSFVLLERS